jgi:CRISPR-associated protein Csx3
MRVERSPYEHIDVLTVHPVHQYLDYTEAGQLTFPRLPTGRGLIISGKLPFWLVTALVRLYNGMCTSWIACHYPPLNKVGAARAVIVVSHTPDYAPGDVIALPAL